MSTEMKSSTRWIFSFIFMVLKIFPHVPSWSLNKILMTGQKYSVMHDNITRNADLLTRYPAYIMLLESLGRGAQKAMDECRYQFKWERWNCEETALPIIQQSLYLKANRETAYVQAINSAGVMFVITEQCSIGINKVCGCDFTRNGKKGGYNWQWGGCSDNIRFGERMSKQSLDSMVSAKDAHAAMNLQNNGAGRKAVKKTARLICKCHGVSGSCSVRTCWQQLANFRSVGFYLKRKYRKAIHVNFYAGKLQNVNEARGMKLSLFSDKDLVFLETSPDYCKINTSLSLKGTEGRECSRSKDKAKGTKSERNSCKTLCRKCGLRIKKETRTEISQCNCSFHWCCQVTCHSCKETVDVYFCTK